jgi:hypothetical protein
MTDKKDFEWQIKKLKFIKEELVNWLKELGVSNKEIDERLWKKACEKRGEY